MSGSAAVEAEPAHQVPTAQADRTAVGADGGVEGDQGAGQGRQTVLGDLQVTEVSDDLGGDLGGGEVIDVLAQDAVEVRRFGLPSG
jgi:hypothetical protein